MGCDGGTIPKRDELVRTKKKPEQKDKHSELSFKWGHCSITQQPLQNPIVACQLGRLYNKDAVIEGILDRSSLPENAQHIKNLKDVRDLNLTDNPAFHDDAKKGDSYSDNHSARYICPVIGLEMNGKFRFIFLWKCGCVMSERALKAVKTHTCHKCQQKFSDGDIIILNGTEEDIACMRSNMSIRHAKLKAEKKLNKNKSSSTSVGESNVSNSTESQPSSSKQSDEQIIQSNSSNCSKEMKSDKLKRPLTNKCSMQDPTMKKMKANYSVAKDPKATEVFKSLFTSHKNASGQSKAHWITYNPFYN